MKDKLSIVIVNWRTYEYLGKCIKSIKRYPPSMNYEVWVVDNSSDAQKYKLFKKKFPKAKIIANKENAGFARANNLVLKKINSKYALLLNPDTEVKQGALNSLLKGLQSEKVAACGPKMLDKNGKTQHQALYRKLPSVIQALFFYTDLYRLMIKSSFLVETFWESNVNSRSAIEVEQIPGACLMVKTETLKVVNFLDEGYPIWFEDVDLCYKLKVLGYKLMYIPESKIIHIGGASFDRWEDSLKKEERFWKSLFIYFDKNKNIIEQIMVRIIVKLNLLFLLISRFITQLVMPNRDRKEFLKLKFNLLLNLLFI